MDVPERAFYTRRPMRKLIAALLFPLACSTACGTGSQPVHHPDGLENPSHIFTEIDATIDRAIAEKKIPGGVYHFERVGAGNVGAGFSRPTTDDGRLKPAATQIYEKAYGNRALVPNVEPMTIDTMFDAASLTRSWPPRRRSGCSSSAARSDWTIPSSDSSPSFRTPASPSATS